MLRQLTSYFHALRARRGKRWPRHFPEWLEERAPKVLKSGKGDAHLAGLVAVLAARLAHVVAALDRGPAVLDDRAFATDFQHALSWIAYQEEVTGRESTLRAYCDITASLALLDLLVPEIATR